MDSKKNIQIFRKGKESACKNISDQWCGYQLFLYPDQIFQIIWDPIPFPDPPKRKKEKEKTEK